MYVQRDGDDARCPTRTQLIADGCSRGCITKTRGSPCRECSESDQCAGR